MFDDENDAFENGEDSEPDYYADIPEEAFYYEESAYKYGFQLGQKDAEEGIASSAALENFPYPTDADTNVKEIFKDAYMDAVKKFNSDFSEYEDELDEWN